MPTPDDTPLSGLTLLSFESRRAAEMAELIRRFGGTPISAPSMREVPLATSPEAEELLRRLEGGGIDVIIFLTGVGTRALAAALAERCPRERFAELLRTTTVVVRGPKPVAALRELGVVANVLVPEPNTWRELLAALDASTPVAGRRVAVQEYGRSNDELLDGLRARGADVLRVPVYRWDYPEDVGPLRDGVARFADGAVDLVLFTSARQVDHVVETARRLGRLDDLVRTAQRLGVASIGPVCSEALHAHGLPVDLEPEHPKMGHLVNAVAQRGRALLAAKRGKETTDEHR
jgi:uroporphyrinogen-III synthase